jgi:hypothetical protein
LKLGSAIFLNIFKEHYPNVQLVGRRCSQKWRRRRISRKQIISLQTHHQYMLFKINTVRTIKARDEQSSNVKLTQKQPSPHQFNRSSIEEEKSDLKKSSHFSQTPNKQSFTSFQEHAYGNKWHKQNKRSQQKRLGFLLV